jgi:MFS family permease
MLGTAFAPDIYFALLTFACTGAANGVFGASNRMLMHRSIPESVHGRAFGLCDSLDAWGFGLAVIAGGALSSAFGGRATFAVAAIALLGLFAAVAFALRPKAFTERLTSDCRPARSYAT